MKYELILIPDSDDQRKVEDIEDFDEMKRMASGLDSYRHYVFDTEAERKAFQRGVYAMAGRLGDGVHQVEELLSAIHPNKYLVSLLSNVEEDDILVTEYNGVTPEQVKDTATNIIRLAQRLGHLPIELHDSICHEIKELLKLD